MARFMTQNDNTIREGERNRLGKRLAKVTESLKEVESFLSRAEANLAANPGPQRPPTRTKA